MLGMQLV